MATITSNRKGNAMASTNYHIDPAYKAYTAIANILAGHNIRPEWELPSVEDVTQRSATNLIVWFSDGTTYQISLTETDSGGFHRA